LALVAACGTAPDDASDVGAALGGSGATGSATQGANGGSGSGAAPASGGASAASGGASLGSSSGGGSAVNGGTTAAGGEGASGGQLGAGGTRDGTCGGEPLLELLGPAFSCGGDGHVFEEAGPPNNRVNYIIVGDGYDSTQIETLFIEHVENMLYDEQAGFFSAIGEPYSRYRNFINICGVKLASADGCIDNPDQGRACDTLFDGRCEPPCDTAGTRLGTVNRNKVNQALDEALPSGVDVDWVAATINAEAEGWWNSGGPIMVWNGGYESRLQSASVALHEGGHTYHQLADEYGGTSQDCGEFSELNSTADPAGEKWAHWLAYNDERQDSRPLPSNLNKRPYGTFVQGAYEGSRYCDHGQYRPSEDSEMNLLPQPFNMPSIEKIILDIYSIAEPIDAHTDNSEPLIAPKALQVRVIDTEVLKLEWTVDGQLVSGQTSECFVVPSLTAGAHEISVRVYDDTPWVRKNQELLEQTVTWQVTAP